MKNNLPIIVGVTLPILMVIVIAGFVWIPASRINPEYSFVFTYQENRYDTKYSNYLIVENNKIVKKENTSDNNLSYVKKEEYPKIYKYDFSNQGLDELSFEEAQNLTLDKGPTSPDGYIVDFYFRRNGYNIASEIFGGSDRNYNAWVLKGDKAKGINIPNLGSDYYQAKNFIGWIIK